MAQKRFGTQLKEFLSGLGKNERLTPTQLIERLKTNGNGKANNDASIIEKALSKPRFVKQVLKTQRRSTSGRVVIYTRKDSPMVMTIERYIVLQSTIKAASKGLREYHAGKSKK